jgi:hypothetical protein
MKVYNMMQAPMESIIQSTDLGFTSNPLSSSNASLAPLIIMRTEIITGVITGPHHGSGIRKSRSQSKNE